MLRSIIVNDYQAILLCAALEVFETETEISIHNSGITAEPEYNDVLLTRFRLLEESIVMNNKIRGIFNLPEKK